MLRSIEVGCLSCQSHVVFMWDVNGPGLDVEVEILLLPAAVDGLLQPRPGIPCYIPRRGVMVAFVHRAAKG